MASIPAGHPIWIRIGAIAALFARIVAALPIRDIRSRRQKRKSLVRDRFLIELYEIHRLLVELILTELIGRPSAPRIFIRVALPALISFVSIDDAYAELRHLSRPEKKHLAAILGLRGRRLSEDESEADWLLSNRDVIDTEYFACGLIQYMEGLRGRRLAFEEIRMQAYNECFDRAQYSDTVLPTFDTMDRVVTAEWGHTPALPPTIPPEQVIEGTGR